MHPIATTTPGNSIPIPSTNPPDPGLSTPGSTPNLARLLTWLDSTELSLARLGSTPGSAWPRPPAQLSSAQTPAPGYPELPPHDDMMTAVAVALAIALQALQANPSFQDFTAFQALQALQLPKLLRL